MARLVCMPAVSANAEDAVLVEWNVKEGDEVRGGDSLGGIETDKAVVDLEADDDGVVGRLLVEPGARVAVGAPLAVLLGPGDSDAEVDVLLGAAAGTSADAPDRPAPGDTPFDTPFDTSVDAPVDAPAHDTAPQLPAGAATGTSPHRPAARARRDAPAADRDGAGEGRVFASPLARRLAREAGLALHELEGSGPGGRIVKRDIEQQLAAGSMQEDDLGQRDDVRKADPGKADPGPGRADADFDLIPHTPMRLAIARRLTESKSTIPHFYVRGQCRADALAALRGQLNAVAPRKLSINDLIVRAAACALRDVPEMNVTWSADALRRHRHPDIAVAVATEGGLITPIVRRADELGTAALGRAMAALVERARAGRLAPADYEGGTFGISNLGTHGVKDFAAIINPPQSAMLAVGAIVREPVVVDDAVLPGLVMHYTLSVDHRAIDGALAARWLTRFTHYMEQPLAMLV
jgi:pyruvate dehydrogenase E2 component (dihydrolipoamide acetyltransferase)